jgi:uncharacterized protein YdiU (UPF0061 family)
LNTDNTSLLGLTLDYGPFGFLDGFDINHICNHSDHAGRYAYHRQGEILHWNLYCLASAMLSPLKNELAKTQQLNESEAIERIKTTLASYSRQYTQQWQSIFKKKLGLSKELPKDIELLEKLMQTMHEHRIDFTLFFRGLSEGQSSPIEMSEWFSLYQERLTVEDLNKDKRLQDMQSVNPKYILRNHLAQHAIEKAQKKDFSEIAKLLKILENPFQNQDVSDVYALPPPPEMEHIAISCSS